MPVCFTPAAMDARMALAGPLAPGRVIALIRGFACLFWGIPISLLVFSRLPDLRLGTHLYVPVHLFGLLLMYRGTLQLQRANLLTLRWGGLVRQLMLALVLQVYLSPFVFWWKRMPGVPLYQANLLLLAAVAMYTLRLVSRLAGEWGARLDDRVFRSEAAISGWTALGFLALPILLVPAGLWLLLRGGSWDESLALATQAAATWPRWTLLLFAVPASFTMAVAWKAKELGFELLKTQPAPPARPTAPPD